MSPEGFFSICLSLFACLYAASRRQLFYSFGFFAIFFLGVVQIEVLLAMRAYELKGLFVFEISEESLHTARLMFELITLVGIIFMKFTALPNLNINYEHKYLYINVKTTILVILTFALILTSLILSAGTYESGRPVFLGIGIVLGLLLPISLCQILLSKNYFHKTIGITGLLIILLFSRILLLISLLTIIIYKIKVSEWKMPSVFKLLIFGVAILLGFFISGQFKHLIAQGFSYEDALLSSLRFDTWLFNFSEILDRSNLGISTNYIIGIEWGSEVADCINAGRVQASNLVGTFSDIYNSFFPSFIRYPLDLNLSDLSCGVAVIKSPLVDLYRAFGFFGLLLFIILLWSYVSKCERYANIATNNFKIFCVSIFGAFSIFLIRGSIGAFISFSIALIFGLLIVKLTINK